MQRAAARLAEKLAEIRPSQPGPCSAQELFHTGSSLGEAKPERDVEGRPQEVPEKKDAAGIPSGDKIQNPKKAGSEAFEPSTEGQAPPLNPQKGTTPIKKAKE